MIKIRTSLNYDPSEDKGEISLKPTQTIPDEALSIQEILQRFTQGYEFPRKPTHYDDTDDFDDVDPTRAPDFDLSDAHQELMDMTERIASRKTKGDKKEPGTTDDGVKPEEV